MKKDALDVSKRVLVPAIMSVVLAGMSPSHGFFPTDNHNGWRLIGQMAGETGVYHSTNQDTVKTNLRRVKTENVVHIAMVGAGNAVDVELA